MLIRVLSHEIRNSLTPVQSLAEYLQQKLPAGREQEALTLIRERSQHLQDFVSRYAKLNQPLTVNWQAVDAKALAQGLQLLYPKSELKLEVAALTFLSDPALLQQLLINLLKNAIEAGSPPGTMVMHIRRQQDWLWLTLKDEGHGVLNPADLFVPFYSTKAQGQGIGLALCRQIAQSLGGEISLQNRSDGISGSEAHLKLPWRRAT
ncbi:HAMP domain-containing histidine kinase [Shewanella sp. JM162201]|uniref:histidine kinase n=1 Tax=Shewanella jiangmenensis TaxID=2837387 RepID=A0ABS5V853_9GAMM|nr:HAMP domain-containing sensor histidine kinase [Shewanella jiangmenensis]MBT1446639.1 HAMP domain-containing histidine kinase [Shewanella jiangmenensis]